MTRTERLLASRLLELMSEHYGNHGCNETNDELLAGISAEEQEELALNVSMWNSPDDSERMKFRQIPDFVWMSYLSAVLSKETK